MSRSFTDRERETIKKNLQAACTRSWTQFGYKKTNVDLLCQQVGISKGAFYLFYTSKEALFCEVLCSMQEELCRAASSLLEKQPNKRVAAEALKLIYREYDKNNFLYNANSTDFTILMNKLTDEQAKKLEASNQMCKQLFLAQPYLHFKVSEDLAMSVIYSLIMNVKNKDVLPCSHIETFDFMVDKLIDTIYE